ncbi:MAG: acetyl-CoA carboxylase biotin carboxylase subunit [bacterium]|nr:acetyl-CoA carboxylase biotin carboxylase subunit [bacterium]
MSEIEGINTVLIANRGEIALRVIESCRRLNLRSVAVYSTADRDMPHVRAADFAVEIGAPEAAASYLNVDRLVQACREANADAVHPGYGFLSENAAFARRLADEGIRFIGPSPDTILQMGDKISARKVMEGKGVPVVPGYHGDEQSDTILTKEAERIGYPVMIKASAGGGGRGMRLVHKAEDFVEALTSARREALNAFSDDRVFIEKFVTAPRHIEIQVFGDSHGNVVHLFERECSIQRRHQKIIEESPSPAITPEIRQAMAQAAIDAAQAVNYLGAGTVEFIYSDADQSFYFLEMNTRLQVEHPVTEMVTGKDLVAEQIRVAAGQPLSFRQEDLRQSGHAIEVRLYAEDPAKNFMPATGPVYRYIPPVGEGVRVDSGIDSGAEISIYYDPMVAKIIAYDESGDRRAAIQKLDRALADTVFFGPENNLDFLREILAHREFQGGKFTTGFIEQHFAGWRGPTVSPADRETARLSVGLLHYNGAANFGDPANQEAVGADQAREPAAAGVANQGGDLAPWYDLQGFRLWENT